MKNKLKTLHFLLRIYILTVFLSASKDFSEYLATISVVFLDMNYEFEGKILLDIKNDVKKMLDKAMKENPGLDITNANLKIAININQIFVAILSIIILYLIPYPERSYQLVAYFSIGLMWFVSYYRGSTDE